MPTSRFQMVLTGTRFSTAEVAADLVLCGENRDKSIPAFDKTCLIHLKKVSLDIG